MQRSGHLLMVLGLLVIIASVALLSLFSGDTAHPDIYDTQGALGLAVFSPDEKQWIADHPVIRVAPDPRYPPFEMLDDQGVYTGISADYLHLISEKTGLTFQVVRTQNFSESASMVQDKTADMLGAVYLSDLRDEYLVYSRPYFETPMVIITNATTPGPLKLEDLTGQTVAAIEGYTTTRLLMKEYPGIILSLVPDTRSALLQVSMGQAAAFFGDLPTATAIVDESGISNLHVSGVYEPKNPQQFSLAFGVRKDWPELASILTSATRMITPQERDDILARWISSSLTPQPLNIRVIVGIIAVFGFIILILGSVLVWNRSLQRAVDEKTRELSHELEERKRAEGALSMTRFSLDRAIDPVIWTDGNGVILAANEAACHRLEYPHDVLVGMTIFDLDPSLGPEGWNEHWKKLKNEGVLAAEGEYLTRSGAFFPVEVRQNFFEYGGREGNCSIIRDISERKKNEVLIGRAFSRIDQNMEQFGALNDQIRNPLNIILCHASELPTDTGREILEQVQKIDEIVDTLDQGWVQSEKIRAFLRKHYCPPSGDDPKTECR